MHMFILQRELYIGIGTYERNYTRYVVLGTSNYIVRGCLTNRIHRQILSQNIIELFRRCMVDGLVTGGCDGINRFIIPDQKVMYLFSKYILKYLPNICTYYLYTYMLVRYVQSQNMYCTLSNKYHHIGRYIPIYM